MFFRLHRIPFILPINIIYYSKKNSIYQSITFAVLWHTRQIFYIIFFNMNAMLYKSRVSSSDRSQFSISSILLIL